MLKGLFSDRLVRRKVGLSVGMLAIGFASILTPELTAHIAVGSTAVNLLWLWEV